MAGNSDVGDSDGCIKSKAGRLYIELLETERLLVCPSISRDAGKSKAKFSEAIRLESLISLVSRRKMPLRASTSS